MRDLIISIICMLVLVIPWGLYDKYASDTIDNYKTIIKEDLIPAIENNDWETAEKDFDFIAEDWDDYKKKSAFFIDNEAVNEVDSTVSKAYYYIKLHDSSNSAGELAYLKDKLDYLHKNEDPSLANVF